MGRGAGGQIIRPQGPQQGQFSLCIQVCRPLKMKEAFNFCNPTLGWKSFCRIGHFNTKNVNDFFLSYLNIISYILISSLGKAGRSR